MTSPYAAIYARQLLPIFGLLDPSRHPWWWPKNGGKSLDDWGLTIQDVLAVRLEANSILRSLRSGPQHKTPPTKAYDGFPGSVVLTKPEKLIWVLSSRPSSDGFPNSGGTTTRLYNVLAATGILDCVHVTDFVKFRGPGPDQKADAGVDDSVVVDGASRTLRELSLRCLEAEWQTAPPRAVLVAGAKAQAWIINQIGQVPMSGAKEFLRAIGEVIVPVTSWMAMAPNIAAEWRVKLFPLGL